MAVLPRPSRKGDRGVGREKRPPRLLVCRRSRWPGLSDDPLGQKGCFGPARRTFAPARRGKVRFRAPRKCSRWLLALPVEEKAIAGLPKVPGDSQRPRETHWEAPRRAFGGSSESSPKPHWKHHVLKLLGLGASRGPLWDHRVPSFLLFSLPCRRKSRLMGSARS